MLTPEETQRAIKDINEKMEELHKMIYNFYNDATIDINVDAAIRARFIQNLAVLSSSSEAPTAHNKTVHEGGSATYDVMDKPTGFVQTVINGQAYVIPYF